MAKKKTVLRATADRFIDALGLRDAVDGATKAANESGLPQGVGGPADAYRHLLIVGELKRRFGPLIGAELADAYESMNDREGQSPLDLRMDRVNNALALNGPDFKTFEDLQRWARGKISEAAPFNGDGQDGRVMWHHKTERGWRPDWSQVPLLSIERGGAEHHWRSASGSDIPGETADNPLDRVMAAWSKEDIAAIMQSTAYLRSSHPEHAQAQALVRAWFERNYGDGPVARDATEPLHGEVPGRRGSADPAVQVRAHTREGGKERVRAHTRSWPD